MKVIATADLHGTLPTIPECDLLIVAGDVCPVSDHNPVFQCAWLRNVYSIWLRDVPAKHVVWIAGNHDFVLDEERVEDLVLHQGKMVRDAHIVEERAELLKTHLGGANCHYLKDEALTVDGIRLYGTPWVPNLPEWAFPAEGTKAEMLFKKIPANLDVLISHGPPQGIADRVSISHVGSMELLAAVEEKAPKVIVCGHIHEGYGLYRLNQTDVYSVSHMDRMYRPINEPIAFELKGKNDAEEAKPIGVISGGESIVGKA